MRCCSVVPANVWPWEQCWLMMCSGMIGRDRTVWYNLAKFRRHPEAGQHGGEKGKPSTVHSWRNGSDHDQKWIMAAEGTFSLPLGSLKEGRGLELRKKRKTKLPAASHSHPSGASGSPTEVVCWNGPINLLAPERNFRNWLQTRIQHS